MMQGVTRTEGCRMSIVEAVWDPNAVLTNGTAASSESNTNGTATVKEVNGQQNGVATNDEGA